MTQNQETSANLTASGIDSFDSEYRALARYMSLPSNLTLCRRSLPFVCTCKCNCRCDDFMHAY